MQSFLFSMRAQQVTAVLLLILVVLSWVFLVREEQAIAADSDDRLDTEQLTLRQMAVENERAESSLARYHGNLNEMESFREHFLASKDERLVAISAFLDERTRERGVGKERVDYQITRGRDNSLEIYRIRLPLEGRYRDIRALIGDIEASDLYLCITELSLEGDASRRGAVSVELGLETFFEGAIDE